MPNDMSQHPAGDAVTTAIDREMAVLMDARAAVARQLASLDERLAALRAAKAALERDRTAARRRHRSLPNGSKPAILRAVLAERGEPMRSCEVRDIAVARGYVQRAKNDVASALVYMSHASLVRRVSKGVYEAIDS